jgi:hypothetical protein
MQMLGDSKRFERPTYTLEVATVRGGFVVKYKDEFGMYTDIELSAAAMSDLQAAYMELTY